ncbi:MAG: MoaD/ThiS family protein [Chloroflexi bacterium]|nr:MoaD/ThiS family protein [Chloroflexota bacterium]
MRVTVELQAYLEQYSPDGQAVFEYTLPDGATVQTLVRQLNVPEEMASVIVLNGRSADFDNPLQDGDKVIFIPPLAGG